jgi:TolB-like protein/DNA-binding winged helix-turn-helix (wHTH) protein
MNHEPEQIISFAEFELDAPRRRLVRDGETLTLHAKAFDLLVFLVGNAGRVVSRDEILETVWDGQFVEESNLTVQISALRKILHDQKDAPRFLVTVPGKGYKFIADLQSDEEIVVESHKFARFVGSHSIEVDAPASGNGAEIIYAPTESNTEAVARQKKLRGRGVLIAASVLIFGVLGLGIWYFLQNSSSAAPIESIAVLPFVNEGAGVDVEYLSDGITESLINRLSQLPKISVKARSTVFRYKGAETAPQQVGADLNVQAIVSGRVIQRGDDLVLFLSLVDARTGNQIWGERYDRKLTDLISLQNEVARDVLQKLKAKLSGTDEQKLAKNYTANPEAYRLYLQGRFFWNKRTPNDFRKAIEYFRQAIALDPNFALAYTGLADAFSLLPNFGGAQPSEAKPKARDAALKALSLDEQLAEAHAALGGILVDYDHDYAGAEREFRRAIELNPNYATTHQWYGELLAVSGRHEEARVEFLRALEIDPFSLIVNRSYGESLLFARKYDEAIAQLKKTLELDANFLSVYDSFAFAYQVTNNYAASVEGFAKFEELIGENQFAALMRESFAKGGWQGFLRTMTGARRPANLPLYYAAIFYVELGEKDKAFAELNEAFEKREGFLPRLKVDPRFDRLRADPRFEDLLRRVGF